jgi:TRAP-type C4-dicarboxylate transport system permease large subunit
VETFTKSMMPWFLLMVIFVLILIFVPGIISVLPKAFYG